MRILIKASAILASVSFFLLLSSCSKNNPVSVTPPGTPTLSLPANGAIDQPVTTALTWSMVSGASTYHIQVSSDSTFPSSSLVADVSSLTAPADSVHWLVDSTTYYWRARAENSGGAGNWTDPWQFTTIKDSSFFEFGRSQGYLGYWAASDPDSGFTRLYDFKGNVVVLSKILMVIDTNSGTITFDTVESYRGVFVLDSSVTPNAMDIHLTTPQYKGQTIQTIYHFLPPSGSFEECDIMMNAPGAARPTYMPDPLAQPPDPNINKFLPLMYQWTH